MDFCAEVARDFGWNETAVRWMVAVVGAATLALAVTYVTVTVVLGDEPTTAASCAAPAALGRK